METNQRIEAVVSGTVQGVSFRYYTQRKAMELGLTGWVRNEPDGTVRLVAEGVKEALEKLLTFVRQGPTYAKVEKCEHAWSEGTGEFERFRIVH